MSIDPSDVQKPYAQEGGMPLLAKVWDGSEGRVGDNLGYNLCFAIDTSVRRAVVDTVENDYRYELEEGASGEDLEGPVFHQD